MKDNVAGSRQVPGWHDILFFITIEAAVGNLVSKWKAAKYFSRVESEEIRKNTTTGWVGVRKIKHNMHENVGSSSCVGSWQC